MAFHPYPQVIPQVFNPGGFGPPHGLTRASPCPWVDHPASGLGRATIFALFGLAFAPAPPHGLTSPHAANSQAHSSKGTPSHPQEGAPTACRHTVSGTLSLPSRGTFHLSLTVLVRYRSPGSIQAYQVVLADSHEISRAPCYSGTRHTRAAEVSPTGVSPSPPALPRTFDYPHGHARRHGSTSTDTPHNPAPATPAEYHHGNGLATIRFRSPLLTESLLFSLPAGTEMFHFPAFPPTALSLSGGGDST